MASYREIGGQLGAYIRAKTRSTAQVQAFLADLMAGDELLGTMRDVAGKPSFQVLHPLVGSGTGSVQRDALLQDLARWYLPEVISDISQVVNGMLDMPSSQRSSGVQSEAETTKPITNTTSNIRIGFSPENSTEIDTKPLDVKQPTVTVKQSSSTKNAQINQQLLIEAQYAFYCNSAVRVFWLSLITGGIYDILWFYRFWNGLRRYEKTTGRSSSGTENRYPLTRFASVMAAIFSGFFIVGTARRINVGTKRIGGSDLIRVLPTFLMYPLSGLASRFLGEKPGLPSLAVILIAEAISSAQLYKLQRHANQVVVSESGCLCKSDFRLRIADCLFIAVGLVIQAAAITYLVAG